ncbi:replicative DNA helicase [Candidatus Dependentiae bacterium]|nr:replicative DNA helicase [Candidatus Dependentiae bacterium]
MPQKNQKYSSTRSNATGGALALKGLPASQDAERAVLAAILLNEENLSLVSDFLAPQDFYVPANKLVYQAVLDLSRSGKKIDVVTLQDLLSTRNELEEIGGSVALFELQEDLPAIGMALQHAKIVKDKSLLRGLITSSTEIISSCYQSAGENLESLLDSAEKRIFQISNNLSQKAFVPISDVLKGTFKRLAELSSRRDGITGITTGFHGFDKMTSGMQKGDLVILAARPSMGKTALMLNMALNACHAGSAIGVFSLEMSSDQLVLRMLSSESKIPHHYIRNATITSDEWMDLTNTAARLAESKIFIDDTASISIMELRAKARRLKAKHNIEMLVIDYLQLIAGDGNSKYENRTQEISVISRSLKALAKELDIVVLAASQLSRSLENRLDKRPLLSDLRESGAIEQDGDVIFFIYRDIVYNRDTEHPDEAELIIGKQRNGPTGTVRVKFVGELTKFEDLPEASGAHH